MSDMNQVLKVRKRITIDGVEQNVNLIRLDQLERVMTLVEPIKNLVMKPVPQNGNKASQKPVDITNLVFKHGTTVAELVAEIQAHKNEGVTLEWVRQLDLDDLIQLTSEVIEANLDFFIQRVLPALAKALGSLTAGIQLKFLGGTIPSPSSSNTDTEQTT